VGDQQAHRPGHVDGGSGRLAPWWTEGNRWIVVIIAATTVRGRIRLHPRDQCPTWRTAKGRRQIASGRSQGARTIAGNTDGRPGHLVIQSRGAPFFSKEWSRALQREALESRRVTTPLAPQRGIKRALVTSGSPPIASVRRRGAFDAMGQEPTFVTHTIHTIHCFELAACYLYLTRMVGTGPI
jgi:hypothetical protein